MWSANQCSIGFSQLNFPDRFRTIYQTRPMNVKQLLLAKTGSPSPSAKLDGFAAHHEHYPSSHSCANKPEKESLMGEAELLLSFANIARCEITDHPRALDGFKRSKLHLPLLPSLVDSSSSCTIEEQVQDATNLAPRGEAILSTFKPLPPPNRLRAVSFDTHSDGKQFRSRTPSPSQHTQSCTRTPMIVSPDNRRPLIHSTRQSHRARRQTKIYRDSAGSDSSEEVEEDTIVAPVKKQSGGRLQVKPPSGVEVITIHRRKFSWKNYPEVCNQEQPSCRH